jgi:hypothetical protein
MAAPSFTHRLFERAFRADFFDDALEAAALNPLARHIIGRKVRSVFSLPPAVRASGALFIHIPKNAGTSVAHALYGTDVYHRSMRLCLWAVPDFTARAYKFALLRNPVERFLSSFDFMMEGRGEMIPVHEGSLRRISGVRTIDAFLDYLETARSNWVNIDNAARPQNWYIVDRSGRIAVDELFTLEAIGEVQQVVRRFGGGKIPHINRTRRSTQSLSAAQLARLRRIYEADFALYAFMQGRAPDAARGMQFP